MNDRDSIRYEELSNDGGPYLPICLCLDTSNSMMRKEGGTSRESGRNLERLGPTRLELLMQGIQEFFKAVYADELTRCTVEVAIVTFDDTARLVKNFGRVERMKRGPDGTLVSGGMEWVPKLSATGTRTAMGEGVNLSLDLLEKCKQDYRQRGLDHYRPWLVLMSDGWNNGSKAEFSRAKQRIGKLVSANKLAVYPLAIGAQAGLDDLNALSPQQKAFGLKAVQMVSLFKWLAKSAETVSSGELGYSQSPKLEHFESVTWAMDL